MSRPIPAALLAAGTGLWAATLQFAGALKSLPGIDALPADLTLLAGLGLLASLVLLVPLVPLRRWRLAPGLALPLAGIGLLLLWLVLAGGWSLSRLVLADKLVQVVLLGPPMLLAGLLVGAEAGALARCAAATIGIGLLVAAATAWGVATGTVVLGGAAGADPERLRVQYQLVGLAIASAGGLAAVQAVAGPGWARAGWLLLVALLAVAVLIPGGRAALLALGLGVMCAPAQRLWLAGRPLAGLAWALGLAALGGLALAALLALPQAELGLRTLERAFGDPASATSARGQLWGAAWRWAGEAAPLGLGTGGFTLAAGSGDRRALHPHNHALEALVEAGLPGLAGWLLTFGGAALLACRQAARVAPVRAARITALTLPMALTAMVSTDLGNRMVWFALGLVLSLGVAARRDV